MVAIVTIGRCSLTDRLLDKYLGKRTGGSDVNAEHNSESALPREAVESAAEEQVESADEHGSFGYLRGIRDRAVMLELRKRDGSIMAISYAYLERAEFDPTDGITLHALGRKITITGRNLNAEVAPKVRLFHAITRHRVAWVRESERAESLDARAEEFLITTIQFR